MESVSISEEKKCVCIMEVLAAVFSMVCVCISVYKYGSV